MQFIVKKKLKWKAKEKKIQVLDFGSSNPFELQTSIEYFQNCFQFLNSFLPFVLSEIIVQFLFPRKWLLSLHETDKIIFIEQPQSNKIEKFHYNSKLLIKSNLNLLKDFTCCVNGNFLLIVGRRANNLNGFYYFVINLLTGQPSHQIQLDIPEVCSKYPHHSLFLISAYRNPDINFSTFDFDFDFFIFVLNFAVYWTQFRVSTASPKQVQILRHHEFKEYYLMKNTPAQIIAVLEATWIIAELFPSLDSDDVNENLELSEMGWNNNALSIKKFYIYNKCCKNENCMGFKLTSMWKEDEENILYLKLKTDCLTCEDFEFVYDNSRKSCQISQIKMDAGRRH